MGFFGDSGPLGWSGMGEAGGDDDLGPLGQYSGEVEDGVEACG